MSWNQFLGPDSITRLVVIKSGPEKAPTLQNRLQGSINPLALVEPGPDDGAYWTCCPGPWTNGDIVGDLGKGIGIRGGEY
jgi:hypothetical protein